MAKPEVSAESTAGSAFLDAFSDVSAAGLPQVARASSRALGASVVIVDASGSVLAVACASPADEQAVLARGHVQELRVAGETVGQLRYRERAEPPPTALLRMVGTLIGQEIERSRAPERASEAAIATFLRDLLERRVTDRENILARGHELGAALEGGASVVVARAHPQMPEEGDWRARMLMLVERGARAAAGGSLTAPVKLAPPGEAHGGSAHGDVVQGRGRGEPSGE